MKTDIDTLIAAEVQRLRAELAAAQRECETVGALALALATTRAEVRQLRAALAALTPTWRDGQPPADALVLRERPDGELQAVHTVIDDGRVCILHSSGDVTPWGAARWCPLVRPAAHRVE